MSNLFSMDGPCAPTTFDEGFTASALIRRATGHHRRRPDSSLSYACLVNRSVVHLSPCSRKSSQVGPKTYHQTGPNTALGMQSNFGVRVGRHKACPYRGHGGRLRGTTRMGDRRHRQYAGDAAPTWHDVGGGRCGGSPPAQGRAEGPTAQLQWTVISGQRRRHLPCSGTRIGFSLAVTRGVGNFTPNLDCTPALGNC